MVKRQDRVHLIDVLCPFVSRKEAAEGYKIKPMTAFRRNEEARELKLLASIHSDWEQSEWLLDKMEEILNDAKDLVRHEMTIVK